MSSRQKPSSRHKLSSRLSSRHGVALLIAAVVCGTAATAAAQRPRRPTALDAGRAAWHRHERHRRAAVAEQRYWNELLEHYGSDAFWPDFAPYLAVPPLPPRYRPPFTGRLPTSAG